MSLFRRSKPEWIYAPDTSDFDEGTILYGSSGQRVRLNSRHDAERQLSEAREIQDTSGIRIRIARMVMNQNDSRLERALQAWEEDEKNGLAVGRKFGKNLSYTIFDTDQRPLRNAMQYKDLGKLASVLAGARDIDTLFSPVIRVEVSEYGRYGDDKKGQKNIALSLRSDILQEEIHTVDKAISEEQGFAGMEYINIHRPHITLGRIEGRKKTLCKSEIDEVAERILGKLGQISLKKFKIDLSPAHLYVYQANPETGVLVEPKCIILEDKNSLDRLTDVNSSK